MSDGPRPYPTLDEFIAAFNRFESQHRVFDLRDDNLIPWWDLVRYRVQFELCVERGIYGRATAASVSKTKRARSFVRQFVQLVRDLVTLYRPKMREVQTIALSRRRLRYIENIAGNKDDVVLFASAQGVPTAPSQLSVSAQSFQFFTRLAKRFAPVPADVSREAQKLASEICSEFKSDCDIFKIITSKYREELVLRHIWGFILNRAFAAKRMIFVNDDMVKTFVAMARAKGMDSEEVQHAYMGRSHIAFSYPDHIDALATFPDRVVITRDTGDITYPVEKRLVAPERLNVSHIHRDIDVLIASSPTRRERTHQVIRAMVGQELKVAVKLHPAENIETSGISKKFATDDVLVIDNGDDFSEWAARAHICIPVNATSTTAIEALEMNASVIYLDFEGTIRFEKATSSASINTDYLAELQKITMHRLSQEIGKSEEDD